MAGSESAPAHAPGPPGVPVSAESLFLTDAQLRAFPLDIAGTALRPRLRPTSTLSVLDITEFYGDTTGGVRTYLREKAAYVEAHPALRHVLALPGDRKSTRLNSSHRT